MSQKIIINGPCKLHGEINIQGAKNSAMKHVLVPLITNDKFTLKNIPQIGSIHNLLKIIKLQGGKIKWLDKNKLNINTFNANTSHPIKSKLFYYTSGAIHLIPIIASKYGSCIIETNKERFDTGGDKIGSRNLNLIIKSLKKCGIETSKYKKYIQFKIISQKPFNYNVPDKSFSASVNSTLSALFKKGTSIIKNCTEEAEFEDIIKLLIESGADIKKTSNTITINGPSKLKGIKYTNMSDRHDYVTWLSAALSTNSKLKIVGIDYQAMKLHSMEKTIKNMNIQLNFSQQSCLVHPQLHSIKPTTIYAGRHPYFGTEAQVLFSPLFTQISGKTKVIDLVFQNRMKHWEQLKKMNAVNEYFKDPNAPEDKNNNPRAVIITGPTKLHGTRVEARDVRTGAAMIIAGLIAQGQTTITNIDHIHRGYENIVEKLQSLGADIRYAK